MSEQSADVSDCELVNALVCMKLVPQMNVWCRIHAMRTQTLEFTRTHTCTRTVTAHRCRHIYTFNGAHTAHSIQCSAQHNSNVWKRKRATMITMMMKSLWERPKRRVQFHQSSESCPRQLLLARLWLTSQCVFAFEARTTCMRRRSVFQNSYIQFFLLYQLNYLKFSNSI